MCVRYLQKFQVFKIHFTVTLMAFSYCFLNTNYTAKKIAKKIVKDSRIGNNAICQ